MPEQAELRRRALEAQAEALRRGLQDQQQRLDQRDAEARRRTGITATAPMSPFQLPSTAGALQAGVPPEQVTETQERSFQTSPTIPVAIGGTVGSLAGGVLGSPLGPKGIAGGVILGEGIGSYAGSAFTDFLNQEDLDHARASREAAIGMGISTGVMGAFKVLPGGYHLLKKSLGFGPKETAEDIIRLAERGTAAGSPESLRASQYLLSEGEATFTPFQTGLATRLQTFNERVARVGLISSTVMEENMRAQANVVRRELDEMMTRLGSSGSDISVENVGGAISRIISDGNAALNVTYGRGLERLSNDLRGRMVPTAPLRSSLETFLDQGRRTPTGEIDVLGTNLSDATVNFINRNLDTLNQAGNSVNASSIVNFETRLQREIFQAGRPGEAGNPQVYRELSELASVIRESTVNTLRTINDDVANQFVSLKAAHSQGKNALFPRVNKNFVRAADREAYSAVGNALTKTGSSEQIRAIYGSIDEAFEQAARAGSPLPDGFPNAQAAKNYVREAFIRNHIPNLSQQSDIRSFSHLAAQIERPSNTGRWQAALGDEYPTFKQLMNLLSESSVRPNSNIGELMIRSKEYSGFAQIAAAAGTATVASNPLGVAGAASILFAPVFLAKAATKPEAVNRMLAFDRRSFSTEDAMNVAAINLVADIMRLFPEEDREEIRQYTRLLESGME